MLTALQLVIIGTVWNQLTRAGRATLLALSLEVLLLAANELTHALIGRYVSALLSAYWISVALVLGGAAFDYGIARRRATQNDPSH